MMIQLSTYPNNVKFIGNLIASCSEDRTVRIWEEQIGVTKSEYENRLINYHIKNYYKEFFKICFI